jgi:hypothetical protein
MGMVRNFGRWLSIGLVCAGAHAQSTFQTYQWVGSSFIDGSSTHWEQARDIAFDSKGNAIIVGGTSSADFQTTPGAYDRTYGDGTVGKGLGNAGQTDVFVVKLDPQGKLLWSTYIGGPNYDRAYAVEIGPGDDIYIGGRAGEGFPTTAGVIQTAFAGDNAPNTEYGIQDGFVACLAQDGGSLKWSTYFGETGPGFVRDIDVDSTGQVFVAATSMRGGQPTTPTQAGPQTQVQGAFDSYYGKLAPGGTELLYATFIGGPDLGSAYSGNPSIRVTPQGDVYFAAWDPAGGVGAVTAGSVQSKSGGAGDIVLVRFAKDNSIVFGTYFGGSGDEEMETHLLAVDSAGNAVIGGLTFSTDLPTTPGAAQAKPLGTVANGFLAVISADGKKCLAATYVGGSARDEVEGIAIAPDGDIVFGGSTGSADFPVTANAIDATSAPGDAFIGRMPADLSRFKYLSYFGGSAGDSFRAVAVADNGDIGYAGQTGSTNFPLVNAYDTKMNTDTGTPQAATYARFSPSAGPVSLKLMGPSNRTSPMARKSRLSGHSHGLGSAKRLNGQTLPARR